MVKRRRRVASMATARNAVENVYIIYNVKWNSDVAVRRAGFLSIGLSAAKRGLPREAVMNRYIANHFMQNIITAPAAVVYRGG